MFLVPCNSGGQDMIAIVDGRAFIFVMSWSFDQNSCDNETIFREL